MYSAIVQGNVLFVVSIPHMRKSFKVCFSGPKVSGSTGKNCSCPFTEMITATGWLQLEMTV